MTKEEYIGKRVRVTAPYEIYGHTVKKSFTGIVTSVTNDEMLTVQEKPNRYHQPVPVSAVELMEVQL